MLSPHQIFPHYKKARDSLHLAALLACSLVSCGRAGEP